MEGGREFACIRGRRWEWTVAEASMGRRMDVCAAHEKRGVGNKGGELVGGVFLGRYDIVLLRAIKTRRCLCWAGGCLAYLLRTLQLVCTIEGISSSSDVDIPG